MGWRWSPCFPMIGFTQVTTIGFGSKGPTSLMSGLLGGRLCQGQFGLFFVIKKEGKQGEHIEHCKGRGSEREIEICEVRVGQVLEGLESL